MKLVEPDYIFSEHPTLTCPYCTGNISAFTTRWLLQKDGWISGGVQITCDSEPPIRRDNDSWDLWFHKHQGLPQAYKFPIDRVFLDWINANYRFNINLDDCVEAGYQIVVRKS